MSAGDAGHCERVERRLLPEEPLWPVDVFVAGGEQGAGGDRGGRERPPRYRHDYFVRRRNDPATDPPDALPFVTVPPYTTEMR